MANKVNSILLQGIIEADETYIGDKPRKPNKREDFEPSKRGRGTDKTAILGAVARGGEIIAEVAKCYDLQKNILTHFYNLSSGMLCVQRFNARHIPNFRKFPNFGELANAWISVTA